MILLIPIVALGAAAILASRRATIPGSGRALSRARASTSASNAWIGSDAWIGRDAWSGADISFPVQASAPAPSMAAPTDPFAAIECGDVPSPILTLDQYLRAGQPPPPQVILCAIAEAERMGQSDFAQQIVKTYIVPVVDAAEQTSDPGLSMSPVLDPADAVDPFGEFPDIWNDPEFRVAWNDREFQDAWNRDREFRFSWYRDRDFRDAWPRDRDFRDAWRRDRSFRTAWSGNREFRTAWNRDRNFRTAWNRDRNFRTAWNRAHPTRTAPIAPPRPPGVRAPANARPPRTASSFRQPFQPRPLAPHPMQPAIPVQPAAPFQPHPFAPHPMQPTVPVQPAAPFQPHPFAPHPMQPTVPVQPHPFAPHPMQPTVPVQPHPFAPPPTQPSPPPHAPVRASGVHPLYDPQQAPFLMTYLGRYAYYAPSPAPRPASPIVPHAPAAPIVPQAPAAPLIPPSLLRDEGAPPSPSPMPTQRAPSSGVPSVTVLGKSCPIEGVAEEDWSQFFAKASRELPTFTSARHVGMFRQNRDRLRELGIDDRMLIDPSTQAPNESAQVDAFCADMADAHRHARESGMIDQYVGEPIVVPVDGINRTLRATCSGILGVIQAAGLEGAVGWFENPADRRRFPHTTAAFLRMNGAF